MIPDRDIIQARQRFVPALREQEILQMIFITRLKASSARLVGRRADDLSLRANTDETSTPRKFTLEGDR